MDKEKFFPKYKKDKLVKKYLLNDLKKNSLINRDICHKCETKRVNVCRCKLEESLCEKDHKWYFCMEHSIRVNREYDCKNPCGGHVNLNY